MFPTVPDFFIFTHFRPSPAVELFNNLNQQTVIQTEKGVAKGQVALLRVKVLVHLEGLKFIPNILRRTC